MFLYLDEDVASKELVARLTVAGHSVAIAPRRLPDAAVWQLAQRDGAAVLTQNAPDFEDLATASESHHGLILVYQEGNVRKDMRVPEIVAAIGRIEERLGSNIDDQILVLNQFR